MPIEMKSCTSSSIAAYGYDESTGTLAITFNSGATYRYPGVPADVAAGFDDAKSVGKYFGTAISREYKGELVPQAADDEESEEG